MPELQDKLDEYRERTRTICSKFPAEYWRETDLNRRYPQEFVDALTASGLLASLIPTQYGGGGQGLAVGSVIMEEINHSGGHSAACHAQMYTMGALLRHGSAAQKQAYLPGIASGELRLQDHMPANERGGKPIRSEIARSTATTVTVFGQDLMGMLGTVNLGDFAYLELFKRLPDERESVLFNALVVTLVEHGVTPSVLAARMTYLGAPESLQGAVAAGILGLGNTFVGTIEGAAKICQERLPAAGRHAVPERDRLNDEQIEALAAEIVAEFAAAKRPIPGLGHPVHRPVDPRARKLFELCRELGFDDSSSRLLQALSRLASERSGKVLPVNATGAIGALASTLGVPAHVARGLGVMARAIGLVGHLIEEKADPMATTIWYRAEDEASAGEA